MTGGLVEEEVGGGGGGREGRGVHKEKVTENSDDLTRTFVSSHVKSEEPGGGRRGGGEGVQQEKKGGRVAK